MTVDQAGLDLSIAALARGSEGWAATTLAARADLLASVAASVGAEAERWVLAAAHAKGLDQASPLIGEEWLTGPYGVLTSLAALQHTLRVLDAGHSPLAGRRLGRAPGGRVTVSVLPHNSWDGLLLHGFTAQAWLRPGVTAAQARSRAGLGQHVSGRAPSEYSGPGPDRGIGLVLGAGNISSIAPLDVLYELVAHNRVSILKLNPTFDGLLPVYRAALAPLIEAGLLCIVTGGADVGDYLAHHAGIGHVHITGSAATHDAIVFAGSKTDAPRLTKPITSELGGVSPIIVLPGRWSTRDLRYQAEHVATMRLHNGGYNCIAGQVLVLSATWPQKRAFLDAVAAALASAPARPAWYPGSDERMRAARAAYPAARSIPGGRLLVAAGASREAPQTGGVDSPEAGASAVPEDMLRTEYFAPVLGVIELPGTGLAFLDAAVETVNRDFLGTLGANILGVPSTIRRLGAGFEQAVARLRYGTIAINAWTGVGFLSAAAPWGAFPGHTLSDVQSGIGVVHNALLLDDVERTVVRGPFRPFPRSIVHGEWALLPKPPWFVSARSGALTARLLTEFAARPSVRRLPGILAAAFRA
ncbi:aldehyde dehydrogenase family protein [Cryobacterium sp. TMS1-20-1]|uniref:aldehyde dehydrogenase family protein n=1 Tax=Cryobacterium sp. TMS1-20-1 TaxID=1259223 RepID=UPI00106B5B99|nr:aldehyde dehydrogenase family protein [Cryobacterium sp. TMS1-20-1]TFC77219.1 aldehyde dehydrogenase family protein [Cryobacterium sp. TMS1-20-1]